DQVQGRDHSASGTSVCIPAFYLVILEKLTARGVGGGARKCRMLVQRLNRFSATERPRHASTVRRVREDTPDVPLGVSGLEPLYTGSQWRENTAVASVL